MPCPTSDVISPAAFAAGSSARAWCQTVVPAIRTYIKKRGGSHRRYRHKYIWTKPVSGVIQANRGLLKRMYGKYKSQGKFTVASALHMLRDMKVVLDRLEDVPHEEMVRRLFGSSQ